MYIAYSIDRLQIKEVNNALQMTRHEVGAFPVADGGINHLHCIHEHLERFFNQIMPYDKNLAKGVQLIVILVVA